MTTSHDDDWTERCTECGNVMVDDACDCADDDDRCDDCERAYGPHSPCRCEED